jgi:predicted O-methyltransferase YrrM
MKFDDVANVVRDVGYSSLSRCRQVYDHIINYELRECAELGFAYGKTSCFIAAALDEIGGGHLTAVDLESARASFNPGIEEFLSRLGLSQYVTVVRESTTYNWHLMKMIEAQTSEGVCRPLLDFCFIDGPKNWTNDGFAFFLVDKLLKKNGWLLFDDYGWTYKGWPKFEGTDFVGQVLSEDEATTPHIRKVFELLVMQHPEYSDFRIEQNNSAWARKVASEVKSVVISESYSAQAYMNRVIRRLVGHRRP